VDTQSYGQKPKFSKNLISRKIIWVNFTFKFGAQSTQSWILRSKSGKKVDRKWILKVMVKNQNFQKI
jgi:hypothetical protein